MTTGTSTCSASLTSLPAEIVQLTNLTELDLRNNQLTSLPAEIGQLTNLTELDLGGNQLTILPAEIGQLTNLTTLDLRRNQLDVLPRTMLRLSDVQLDGNPLRSLPAVIAKSGWLQIYQYLVTLDEDAPLDSQYHVPVEIQDSLARFQSDYPDPSKVAFIIMQFGGTLAHDKIVKAIRQTLTERGITALRADDKDYHDDLFPNVLTYVYGCGFAIAIFERIEADDFNPNVSLEVGYLLAMQKPTCLLKDKTLNTLPTDLVGKLYKEFDPQQIAATIPKQLERWLADRELI